MFLFISSPPPLPPIPQPVREVNVSGSSLGTLDGNSPPLPPVEIEPRGAVLVHPCMDVGGSEWFQSHKTVRLESCMEPTRVGEGAGVEVGGWVGGGGGGGATSHTVSKRNV